MFQLTSACEISTANVLACFAAAGALYGVSKFVRKWTRPYFSPLRHIQCLPKSSMILGSLKEFHKMEDSTIHEDWVKKYGTAFTARLFMNTEVLMLMDTRALNHILTHNTEYPKLEESIKALTRLLGAGLLVTEGEKHKQQRKVMNPSFGPPSIRDLTPTMFEKAHQLRDIWLELASSGPVDDSARIEVLSWLSRTTLDIIGLAGFNYEFNALSVNEKPNELSEAFSTIFNMESGVTLTMILMEVLPILRSLPTKKNRTLDGAMKTMRRVGTELIQERKKLFTSEKDGVDASDAWKYKDLLSVLVKANMDPTVPETQRMSDEDILSQIPTFLVAGHETSSTQTTWTLFSLAQHPDIQKRLREELLSVPTDTPSMDELQSLPYLDAVLRESLRLHPAVPATSRMASKDDVIPLSEPIIDKYGKTMVELRVGKGDFFIIPITAVNRMTSLWGSDAEEFNPNRWVKIPESATHIPSVFANVLSFLSGARACIGYRFALVEMKAILFTLIRSFEFELALPADEFTKRSSVVTRPYLKCEKDGLAQMPLLVKPYSPSNQ